MGRCDKYCLPMAGILTSDKMAISLAALNSEDERGQEFKYFVTVTVTLEGLEGS